MKKILVLIFLLIGIVFLAGCIQQNIFGLKKSVSNKLSKEEFHNKYEINGDLEVKGEFIYIKNCFEGTFLESCPPNVVKQIVVSDAAEKKVRVLKNFIKENSYYYIYFPSPRGSYYVRKGEPAYSNAFTGIITEVNGGVVFTPSDLFHYGLVEWSPDENYIALLNPRTNEEHVAVYDVKKKKKIFDEKIEDLREPQVGDPYSTGPMLAWSENSEALYTYNESGIMVIGGFADKPMSKIIKTPVPCLGLTVKGNEFFCHSKMGNLFTGSAKSARQASIFKYSLNGDKLDGPKDVSLDAPIEGEYSGKMFFLDDRYLFFSPVLGSSTIIDTETGRIGETASYNLRGLTDYSKNIPIFNGNLRDDILSTPIKYISDASAAAQ